MITFDEFIKKYDGKGIDQDNSYGFQCMDLYHQYVKECLGLEHPTAPGAVDLWYKTYTDYNKISNTPEGVPNKGDIVIWNKTDTNPWGHVAVFVEGTTGSFRSFDQNYPTGSLCHIQGHYYTNVLGWLSPKGVAMDCLLSNTDADRKTFEELVRKSSLCDGFNQAGYNTVADINTLVADLRKSIDDKQAEINAAKALAEGYRVELRDFIAILADDECLNCRQDKTEIITICEQYGDKLKEFEDLQTAFAALKNTSETNESELKAEVARLQALLANQNVLANVKTSELIKEIVRRLVSIIDKK